MSSKVDRSIARLMRSRVSAPHVALSRGQVWRRGDGWLARPAIDDRDLASLRKLVGGEGLRTAAINRAPITDQGGGFASYWTRALDRLHGRHATDELARARRIADQVKALEPRFRELSDEQLRAETAGFRALIQERTSHEREALSAAEGMLEDAPIRDRAPIRELIKEAKAQLHRAETAVMDAILPEAFAVVCEAARRTIHMSPYDRQIQAGALMHRGLVAEMYTGEGKTLAAVMPAYLAALAGHGMHVLTVNDYLARRDARQMGAIYAFLGLSVSAIGSHGVQLGIDPADPTRALKPISRKEAYRADVTYATPSEVGFDHLRDNAVKDAADRVQRPLYRAIIDELDANAIDEARTPLLLADPGPPPDLEFLHRSAALASAIVWDGVDGRASEASDVEWDRREHWVALTDRGADKMAAQMGVDEIYQTEHVPQLHGLWDALEARFLYRKDENYAVIDGKVVVVGRNGHALYGRRFLGGVHQAIEVKEGLDVQPESRTRASMTMRDLFAMYGRCSGCTGTAMDAQAVLRSLYSWEVARVTPRLELQREDQPDIIFRTRDEKKAAFIEDVVRAHAAGRPILIGVEWTDTAEDLVRELRKLDLPVQVLTAKDDEIEADIIANAGKLGAVTVVTPRGGRGIDIMLGGAKAGAEERARVVELGGLLVMGYEHLDSRRRDEQLRGRAGRQGDPGTTVFYTSLEDALYDGDKEAERIRMGEQPFDVYRARLITERALAVSEGRIHRDLMSSAPFDWIIARHRDRFHDMRDDLLFTRDVRKLSRSVIEDAVSDAFERVEPGHLTEQGTLDPAGARELYATLSTRLPLPLGDHPQSWIEKRLAAIREDADTLVDRLLEARDRSVGEERSRAHERLSMLQALDEAWMHHSESLEMIREESCLVTSPGYNPFSEFHRRADLQLELLMIDACARASAKVTQAIPFATE
jgi:preprotein translocase subunit SecA